MDCAAANRGAPGCWVIRVVYVCVLVSRMFIPIKCPPYRCPQNAHFCGVINVPCPNRTNRINQTQHVLVIDNAPHHHVLCIYSKKKLIQAEARLAQRRQARAEAREIRMRELERQQKEQEQNADRVFDMHSNSNNNSSGGGAALANNSSTATVIGDPIAARTRLSISAGSGGGGSVAMLRGTSMSSRRSSEDSLEEEGRSLRDIRHELKVRIIAAIGNEMASEIKILSSQDVEERFRKAMIANAQLDNERASQTYQIQLLKDKLEDMEESYAQLQREHKDKCRDHDALKRGNDKLTEELRLVQGQLSERDQLITEQGLTIVMVETDDGRDARRSLVTVDNAHLLETVQGSLGEWLKLGSRNFQGTVF